MFCSALCCLLLIIMCNRVNNHFFPHYCTNTAYCNRKLSTVVSTEHDRICGSGVFPFNKQNRKPEENLQGFGRSPKTTNKQSNNFCMIKLINSVVGCVSVTWPLDHQRGMLETCHVGSNSTLVETQTARAPHSPSKQKKNKYIKTLGARFLWGREIHPQQYCGLLSNLTIQIFAALTFHNISMSRIKTKANS